MSGLTGGSRGFLFEERKCPCCRVVKRFPVYRSVCFACNRHSVFCWRGHVVVHK